MVAQNNTDGRETIALGLIESHTREPFPALVFEQIGAGSSAHVDFTPILGGYIASGYQQNAVIRSQISTLPLFKENLITLPTHTDWKIEYHCGEYKITRDHSREGWLRWLGPFWVEINVLLQVTLYQGVS